jgi:hypothetical protein
MKKNLSLIITLSLFLSFCHCRFKFSELFKRKDNEWKSLCDSSKGGDTVLFNGGFFVSSEEGLYTDANGGNRKLLYKKFKKELTN